LGVADEPEPPQDLGFSVVVGVRRAVFSWLSGLGFADYHRLSEHYVLFVSDFHAQSEFLLLFLIVVVFCPVRVSQDFFF
jgi:hypothetical protein